MHVDERPQLTDWPASITRDTIHTQDAIPTATIAFILDYFFWREQTRDGAAAAAANERRRAARGRSDVVDVKATAVEED